MARVGLRTKVEDQLTPHQLSPELQLRFSAEGAAETRAPVKANMARMVLVVMVNFMIENRVVINKELVS